MKHKREKYTTGAPWEAMVGYSRAIRTGNLIEVSGTIALNEKGESIGIGDASLQTREIINIASRVLQEVGSCLEDVIRTRIYVTDIGLWEEIGKAHGDFFSGIRPASTMVQVSALIRPEALVEIEFTAVVDE